LAQNTRVTNRIRDAFVWSSSPALEQALGSRLAYGVRDLRAKHPTAAALRKVGKTHNKAIVVSLPRLVDDKVAAEITAALDAQTVTLPPRRRLAASSVTSSPSWTGCTRVATPLPKTARRYSSRTHCPAGC